MPIRRLALLLAAAALPACTAASADRPVQQSNLSALQAAVANPARTPAFVQRDRYRHPAETLAFFGVQPSDTVVEIWPGGGWYTEILAPYLHAGGGRLIAAPRANGTGPIVKLVEKGPAFASIGLRTFPEKAAGEWNGTNADAVLTFRNVHNWIMADQPFGEEAFRQMYAMLKPGGVLGIEEHRLPESADIARERSSGYLKVSTVRRLAEAAGFRFVGASEINANPKDTADWPDGVWTLPPTLRLKDKDREKYLTIGESDRMTLKFVRPGG